MLCVPFDRLKPVCAAAEAKKAAEDIQMAEIEAGTSDRAWVDQTLARLGCEMP